MKASLRIPATALTVAALAVLATGCKPGDKATKPEATAATTPADAKAIPGLATEKDRVSYMVGMAMAKQLEPIKDEIDAEVILKAVKSSLAGEKLLLDESQASEIGAAFGQKMQAKQVEKMLAEAKQNLAAGQAFLANNAKQPGVQTTASGLQYQVLSAGQGAKPTPDDTVRVHYTGTLLGGKTFDSTQERGEPATIPLAQVVPGWREGITLMPVGSKYRFWIPGNLGYGEQGTPGGPIGPNATLVFEVELLEIAKPDSK
jgi:FKBP-type peptidyl-prolyl cis-trans isomerase FkpA/FKBP-type peptidyl-prolyl cis-trans isomerase FklB